MGTWPRAKPEQSDPQISRAELREETDLAELLWRERTNAFLPFAARVRALAEAAEGLVRVIGLGTLADVEWTHYTYSLFVNFDPTQWEHRDGPEELWAEFARRQERIDQAMRAGTTSDVYAALTALHEVLIALADALESESAG